MRDAAMNAERKLLGENNVPTPRMFNLGCVTVVSRLRPRSSYVVIVKMGVRKELVRLGMHSRGYMTISVTVSDVERVEAGSNQ